MLRFRWGWANRRRTLVRTPDYVNYQASRDSPGGSLPVCSLLGSVNKLGPHPWSLMRRSSQNLNDRERDRNSEGERKEQVARHSHRFFFMPRSHVSSTPSLCFRHSQTSALTNQSVGLWDQALTIGMTLSTVFDRATSVWIRCGSVSRLPSSSRETLYR
jgi:hypothetical protein